MGRSRGQFQGSFAEGAEGAAEGAEEKGHGGEETEEAKADSDGPMLQLPILMGLEHHAEQSLCRG